MKPIFLASASPRRAELLTRAGVPFEILPTHFPPEVERLVVTAGNVGAAVESVARNKLQHVLMENSISAIVICADTVVAVGDKVLGKPANSAEAMAMLETLSGRAHEVFTAVAAADTSSGRRVVFHERTVVRFRRLGRDEIGRYIETREPFDKAGAYGIQERAAVFVEGVEGCHANVVGLPVARLAAVLKEEMNIDITQHWGEKK